MHKHIGIFAYAETKEEANEKIQQRIEAQTDGEFDRALWDYACSYKDDPRWELLKEPTLSSQCYDLITELQKETQADYDFHLNKLKEEINKDEINHNEVTCWAYLLTSPHSFFLFDTDGETVKDKKTLRNVINKWRCLYEDKGKENPYKNQKVFLMDFDVHY